MIIYNTTLKYCSGKTKKDDKDTLNPVVDEKKFKEIIADANDRLGAECGLDGNLSVQIVSGRNGTFEVIMVCNQDKVSVKECEDWIQNHFSENYSISKVSVSNSREISVKDFIRSIRSADKMGYCNRGYLYKQREKGAHTYKRRHRFLLSGNERRAMGRRRQRGRQMGR